jgi:hypothetical protein
MWGISYPNIAMGIYSYAVAWKDGVSFRSSIQKIDTDHKIQSIVSASFPLLIALVASSSWALLWTHSVGIIHMGGYLPLAEKICFGAFTSFYGKEVCSGIKDWLENTDLVRSYLWDLLGNVSFLAWSISSLTGVVFGISVDPAISLILLLFGVIAFTQSYLCNNVIPKNEELKGVHN